MRKSWPKIIMNMSTWEKLDFMRFLEWLQINPDDATEEQLKRAAGVYYMRVAAYYHPEKQKEG